MASSNATRSVNAEAGVDLTGFLYQFAVFDSNGQIVSGGTTLTAQGRVDGIIAEEVSVVGEVTSVVLPDGAIVKVKLGATLSAGALVATAADGRAIAVTTTAGDQTWGILLEGGVADDIVRMQFGLKDIDPGT